MGKEHQMMEYMVQDLVEMLTEGAGIEYDDAMHTVYDSDIYEKLMDAETGLYRESPSYVFGLLQDEINFGHIVQAEI
jgi:thymidylate synthase